ncbi:MAG TPA: transposase [Dehalococcoidia bacterium]|jgi:REP element-mobilizing transposase RayT|nr:transposase [Dehalococcoidia bacterium]
MGESMAKHRRSIRSPEYDYTSPGAYFVTICAYRKECLLGDPQIRRIVETVWRWATKPYTEDAGIDYVVMPNHLHGIIWIREPNVAGAQHRAHEVAPIPTLLSKVRAGTVVNAGAAPLRPASAPSIAIQNGSLAAIVRTFKSVATQRINAVRGTPGATVWQRNYYEHVVRSEAELLRIREYIANNPLKWQLDRENPDRVPDVPYEKEWEWLEGPTQ